MVAYLPHCPRFFSSIIVLIFVSHNVLLFVHPLSLVVTRHPSLILSSLIIFFIPRKGLSCPCFCPCPMLSTNWSVCTSLPLPSSMSLVSHRLSTHIFLIDCCIIFFRPSSSNWLLQNSPRCQSSLPLISLRVDPRRRPRTSRWIHWVWPRVRPILACPAIFGDASWVGACDSARHLSDRLSIIQSSSIVIDTLHHPHVPASNNNK